MPNETIQGVTVRVSIQGSMTGSNGVRQTVDYTYEQVFSDGTGNNQCGAIYQTLGRSLATTSETIDLDGLTNAFGGSMSDNNACKVLLVRLVDTTTGARIKVGGGDFCGASGPFADTSDKAITGPDGLLLWVSPRDGMTITASTGDGLLVETTTTTTYDTIALFDNA